MGKMMPTAKPGSGSNDERFKLLVESVSDYAIFLLDPKGFIQSWNAGAQRFKGYRAEEIIGKHFSIFYTKPDIDRSHPQHELQIADRAGKFEEEGWRVRKDGTTFWANVVITKLVDSAGVHVGYAKVTRDLTERRAAELRLRDSEERYRLLVSAVKDYAIFMLFPDGKIATWNEGAERLKGYAPGEIIGKHFSVFYPEEDKRTNKPAWELEEATLTGRFEDEGWRVRKDGTRFWANVIITAVRNEEGKLLGFSKVTRDMTERRRLEEKLRRSNEDLDLRVQERTEQLEKAVQARDEFMSVVSHELRTPVTSLRLQVQTAVRLYERKDFDRFTERSIKFMSGALRQLDRLADLINDILDVSRISLGQFPIDSQDLDLGVLVGEVVGRFREQAEAVGSSLSFEAKAPVPLSGDRLRLEQVVSNLIMNALKYGNGKPVTVRVGNYDGSAFFTVEDEGMGIALEHQGRIFERFERAISADNISGIGLGLYISKKIVESHGGEITVFSQPEMGSVFKVTLPRNRSTGLPG